MALTPELTALVDGLPELLALSALLVLGAVLLGYLSDKWTGAFYILSSVSIVPLICLACYVIFGTIGYVFKSQAQPIVHTERVKNWAAGGLVLGIVVTAGLAYGTGKTWSTSEQGGKRGSWFLLGVWLHFCLTAWIGHRAAGLLGALTITLPAVAVFWIALFFLSQVILPPDPAQRAGMAFRSLATFSCGRNYPYHRIENRELVTRVPGSKAKPVLAGPGIVLTGPDHVVAISSGVEFKGIRGPGTVFTEKFESIIEPVDLRTQQRMFETEATTRDGIHMHLSTIGYFQLDAGDRQPCPGEAFPRRTSSIYRALHARPMDIVRREEDGETIETRNLRRWDELYEITAAHVTRDVIEQFRLDELLYDPEKGSEDPRATINKLFEQQMTQELREAGIKVLKVDVGNLMPVKREAVFERRILHWQAQWQRKMLEKLGIAEADVERIKLEAQADAQIEMIHTIGDAITEVSDTGRETVVHSVILRFINSLDEMAARPEVKVHLPPEVPQVVRNLPYIIGRAE